VRARSFVWRERRCDRPQTAGIRTDRCAVLTKLGKMLRFRFLEFRLRVFRDEPRALKGIGTMLNHGSTLLRRVRTHTTRTPCLLVQAVCGASGSCSR